MSKARHFTCSLEQYHARREWSHSQIEDLYTSPPLFHGRHISGQYARKSSPMFDAGTVAHLLLTSPAEQVDMVAIIPDDVLAKNGARSGTAWKEWKASQDGKICLKKAEFAPIKEMVWNVHKHPVAAELLATAQHYEFSVAWIDDDTGLHLRARPDMICGQNGLAVEVDFKTTKAVTQREFVADAAKYGYHRQAAWYWDGAAEFGMDVSRFVFIAVDKSPAHQCRVYEFSEADIELGREENRCLLNELAKRLEEDDWSDPLGKDVLNVSLPAWKHAEVGTPEILTIGGKSIAV